MNRVYYSVKLQTTANNHAPFEIQIKLRRPRNFEIEFRGYEWPNHR